MKNTLLFTYCINILVRLLTVNKEELSYPQKSENLRPHSSTSIENATKLESIQSWKCDPSGGTSPLASYKESALCRSVSYIYVLRGPLHSKSFVFNSPSFFGLFPSHSQNGTKCYRVSSGCAILKIPLSTCNFSRHRPRVKQYWLDKMVELIGQKKKLQSNFPTCK